MLSGFFIPWRPTPPLLALVRSPFSTLVLPVALLAFVGSPAPAVVPLTVLFSVAVPVGVPPVMPLPVWSAAGLLICELLILALSVADEVVEVLLPLQADNIAASAMTGMIRMIVFIVLIFCPLGVKDYAIYCYM
jgi:hypothetical protein